MLQYLQLSYRKAQISLLSAGNRSVLTFQMALIGSNTLDLKGMRKPYKDKTEVFLEKDLISKNPFHVFTDWFKQACNGDIHEPNAMCLSTVSKCGQPSARYVLLKGYGEDGFQFYTNYGSRKGKDLEENPKASLTFFWESLRRQIRIEGVVEKLSEKESEDYFHSRPRPNQISALCSHQSSIIPNREFLIEKETILNEKYKDESIPIPKPDYWGGFQLKPEWIEFWQGQSDRLHDRIVFRRQKPDEKPDGKLVHAGEDGWVYQRLSP
ncbi:unnamed protein product [Bemisia tabaci]|uniref:pyridoxal 5'-phosphate synthase n=1 Tax=Bemisia tabaci TaxID=7038 RepID=A0A9P0F2W8_BEMTA|nr:PREDICTED: pyridoxine-5'-phosphate oxidase-like [Bemisia tabaci]CAH0389681.1 unnamed protein product [Bemisia tabaci]